MEYKKRSKHAQETIESLNEERKWLEEVFDSEGQEIFAAQGEIYRRAARNMERLAEITELKQQIIRIAFEALQEETEETKE